MDQNEQAVAFTKDIMTVIERYRSEFNITLITAIGALEVIKLDLFQTETKQED